MRKTVRSPRRTRARVAKPDSQRLTPSERVALISGVTLARLLIAIREHVGLTQEELAKRAGISVPAVRSYETGYEDSPLSDYFRISRALGFDCVCIMHEVDRRMDAAGTPFLDDQPAEGREEFIESRCTGNSPISAEECRRQLEILENLVLPDTPTYTEPKPATRPRRLKK